jgi:hypothetical protein
VEQLWHGGDEDELGRLAQIPLIRTDPAKPLCQARERVHIKLTPLSISWGQQDLA